MPSLEKDLKKAILALPAPRKDRLLLQLLTPNQLLQEQLKFELLEGEDALENRRAALATLTLQQTDGFYYNALDLLIALRSLCPQLAHHAKVTGDLYGEVQLLLLLLKSTLAHQRHLLQELTGKNEALAQFLAKRAEEALQKLHKLHEDLHVEFIDDLNQVLPQLHASAAGYAARKSDLPLRWD